MTNKEQQIKEMAKLCCPFQFNEETCFDEHCNDTGCWALPIAETLYETGYRKIDEKCWAQVRKETAKEIYKELRRQFCGGDGQYRQIIYDCGEGERIEYIEDLIDWKKYGVEVK